MTYNVHVKKRRNNNCEIVKSRKFFIKNHYDKKLKLLEYQIRKEKEHSNKVSRIADLAFDSMENRQKELILKLVLKDSEIKNLKNHIDELVEDKLDMQKQLDELKRKSDQFDAIQENLNRIHMKAQFDAEDVLNSAKDQSMDILNIADKLTYEMNLFKADIKSIIKDLSIGPNTTEDRLNSILNTVNDLENRITKIKLNFYKENGIIKE